MIPGTRTKQLWAKSVARHSNLRIYFSSWTTMITSLSFWIYLDVRWVDRFSVNCGRGRAYTWEATGWWTHKLMSISTRHMKDRVYIRFRWLLDIPKPLPCRQPRPPTCHRQIRPSPTHPSLEFYPSVSQESSRAVICCSSSDRWTLNVVVVVRDDTEVLFEGRRIYCM